MPTPRRGLGRGLDALLKSTALGDDVALAEALAPSEGKPSTATVARGDVMTLSPDQIQANPYQPRHSFDAAGLDELAASIKQHGLIQPLVVTPVEDGNGFMLIAGERRWRAARQAGLTAVPVVVRKADKREMLALAIVENVQRADLDPIEAAEAYRQLMDEFGLTQNEVADIVGKSRVAVANAVRLLRLAPSVRQLLAEGHLSEGHARALLGLADLEEQVAQAKLAIARGSTVREVEDEVRRLTARVADGRSLPRKGAGAERSDSSSGRSAADLLDPDTRDAIAKLEEVLGTRIELRRRGDGGQLVIHFFSDEELSALYDRLLGA